MGFFDSSTTSKTSVPGSTGTEKEIRKVLKAQAPGVKELSTGLLGQGVQQQDFVSQLFQRMLGQQNALNQAVTPEQQGQFEAERLRSLQGLGLSQDQILQQALGASQRGAQLTPEQQGFIGQSADLAIQSGLSDLNRYQQDTLQQLRNASATRGLRPGDTPITNQFSRVGEEGARQAQQLVSGIRQQQAQQSLQYPLQAGQLNLAQTGQAGDLAAQRAAFLGQLQQQAEANRLNYGGQQQQFGLQAAQAFDPTRAFDTLTTARGLNSRTKNSQNSSGFSNLMSSLGAVGSGLSGLSSLGGGSISGGLSNIGGGLSSGLGSLGSLFGLGGGAAGAGAGAGLAAAGGAAGAGGLLSALGPLLMFSDERTKEQVEPLDSRSVLSEIRPVRYHYKPEIGIPGEQAGVMAQDLRRAGLGMAVVDLDEEGDGLLAVDAARLILPTLSLLADVSQRLEAVEGGLGMAA